MILEIMNFNKLLGGNIARFPTTSSSNRNFFEFVAKKKIVKVRQSLKMFFTYGHMIKLSNFKNFLVTKIA